MDYKSKTTVTKAAALRHLFDHSTVNEATGCWEWGGSLTSDGYGQLSNERIAKSFRVKGTHRLAKILIDDWQPASRHDQTRHICRNRRCWNPDHLLTGTARDNAADRRRDGTLRHGEASHYSKLKADDVRTIRAERLAGTRLKVLSERYSVTPSHISRVARGHQWTRLV